MVIINLIFSFFSKGWNFFRSFTPRQQSAIVFVVFAATLTVSALVYHKYTVHQLEKAIEAEREGIAIKEQAEINHAKESVNKAEAEANKVIKTDSNKFSNNSRKLTEKFCSYYCDQGVLDSTCSEWVKETGRVCN